MSHAADAVIAALLLAFTLPLMILVAAAIRCESPGPIFDGEPCIGRGGRRFRMLRFRTTVHRPGQPARRPELTRVGAFLRYTRIDGLPQYVNVLRGEMSIVELDGRSPSFLE
jgi:lipopolysaccharide/colanic/teichoic acid biosynthesis glycosyltransferase